MTGKGDTPRPLAVPPEVLEANWKATFPEPASPDGICDGCLDEEPKLRRRTIPRTLDPISELMDVWLCPDCDTLGDPEE